MSLADTTPFVELVQRWAKKLAVGWIVFMLVGSSYFYINDPITRAHLNYLVPNKIQAMFARNFELKGCTKENIGQPDPLFGFEFSSQIHRPDDCHYGSKSAGQDWLASLILPPIGLLTVSLLITFFSRRMGEYQVGKKAVDLISEHNYLQAYKEIEEDDIQSPELWAKAFALSDGDRDKQESVYVELRTRQLDGR